MSRVVVFEQYGAPEVLQIHDVIIPAPSPHEVRVQIKAIGINRAEALWRKGEYLESPTKFPARLGYDGAGIVEAVGSEVTHIGVGDAVSVVPSFSLNDYSTYGELVLLPAASVVQNPEGISFEEVAALWNPYLTPYGALVEARPITADDTVLIGAASSSTGLGAIDIVNSLGGTSIALTRTSAKRGQLLAAGANHVIATQEQDLVAEVKRITGGKGATVAFDPVGGPQVQALISALRPGGTVFIYGDLSGKPVSFAGLDFAVQDTIVRGHTVFATTTNPERLAAGVKFVSEGLKNKTLRPRIDRMFRFEEIVEAHRYLESNEQLGRVVVTV